jgi:hypothetical protein
MYSTSQEQLQYMDKSPQIFLNIYEPPPHSRYQKGNTKLSSTLWTHNFVVEHIFVCKENCSNYDENIRWNRTQFSHSIRCLGLVHPQIREQLKNLRCTVVNHKVLLCCLVFCVTGSMKKSSIQTDRMSVNYW